MNSKYFTFIIIFISLSLSSLAQKPSCTVDSVKVEGKAVGFDNIVIKTTDTIAFDYSVALPQDVGTQSFYYRVVLKNEVDSSFKVTGTASAQYVSLSEGEYKFIVGAFDLGGNWLARTTEINFRVNNLEVELLDKIDSKEKEIISLKSQLALGTEKKAKYDYLFLAAGILAGIALGGFLSFILINIFGRNKINRGNKMENQNDVVSREEFNKLMSENSNLRAEIAALRGQIDALQNRAQEMKKQNNDLQESLDSLITSRDELEKLQAQKDELFALIIHDIKNPAALIKSLVDLLRSYDLSAVERQEIIDDIAETTSRIVLLSHEVSKILALETSKLILDFQPVQVGEILSDVCRRNKIAATKKNITVTLDNPDNLPDVEIDVQKIDEVIDNLVSNALKFTQEGGKVHVAAFLSEQSITIEVSDNGLGLSESDVRNAFQRGSRLSAQPTSGESSTGLGLWIVKKLIDGHNGRVWVKSTLGKGSTFAFSLPLER